MLPLPDISFPKGVFISLPVLYFPCSLLISYPSPAIATKKLLSCSVFPENARCFNLLYSVLIGARGKRSLGSGFHDQPHLVGPWWL